MLEKLARMNQGNNPATGPDCHEQDEKLQQQSQSEQQELLLEQKLLEEPQLPLKFMEESELLELQKLLLQQQQRVQGKTFSFASTEMERCNPDIEIFYERVSSKPPLLQGSGYIHSQQEDTDNCRQDCKDSCQHYTLGSVCNKEEDNDNGSHQVRENTHEQDENSMGEREETNLWRSEETIGDMWQRMLRFFNDDKPVDEYPSGSKWEGLNLPHMIQTKALQVLESDEEVISADTDIISLITQKRVGYEDEIDSEQLCYVIQTEGCHPGYLKLITTKQTVRSLHAESSENGDEQDTDEVYQLRANVLTQQFQELFNETVVGTRFKDADVVSKGPSLRIQVDLMKNRAQKPFKMILEIDQVLAFPCVSWPREAEGWRLRKRHSGWPSESLISDIVADGCLIVPVPYDESPEEETEWRFSFSWAESKLALSLTDTQRQCYLLLKCLLQDSLALPKVLKSYHLKNILFWACEDIPTTQWTHDNLATIYLYLVDRLLHCLVNHRLPQYFIPENNLFDAIPEDFIADIMVKVSDVRRNPIRHTFDFQKHYIFMFFPFIAPLETIFLPIVKNLEDASCENDIAKVHEAQFLSLLRLVAVLADTKKNEDALASLKDETDLLKFILLYDDRAMDRLESLVRKFEPNYGIKLYEHLIDLRDEPAQKATLLTNLACFCHCAMNDDNATTHEQQTMRSKAEETFNDAVMISSLPCTALLAEYANFLCRTQQWSTAVKILEEVTQNEEVHPNETNSYSCYEACTLEENIRAEVINEGKFEVVSIIYAYYLLVTSYLATQKKAGAEKCAEHMFSVCFLIPSSRGYSLLGYAYLMLENYAEAASAFQQAIQQSSGYKTAQKNLKMCQTKASCAHIDMSL